MLGRSSAFPTLLALAALGALLPACSKDEVIRAEATDSGLGDGSGGGAGGGGGADAGDASDAAPELGCPSGLPGAELVRIDTAAGATYCMDQREVTWGEYNAFVAKKGADMSGQPPECDWNTSYTPEYPDPNDDTPPPYACPPLTSVPADDAAANCVDFCDALAYCEWAGKRLCGRVGGPKKWGRVDIAVTEDAGPVAPQWEELQKIAAGTEMEFQYVCTQGGTTKYPYGDQYEPGKCIDADWVAAKGANSLGVTDLSNRSCSGTSPPFDQVYDLSGSVTEWQNLCGVTGGVACYLMGGSAQPFDSDRQACAGDVGPGSIQGVASVVGFRCCADPVPK